MTARYFIDTNILLYAGSHAKEDAAKRQRAIELLKMPGVGFSAQVLQEYYHVAHRKQRLAISHAEAMASLQALSKRTVVPITASIVILAAQLAERHQLSYWDAAILAAAQTLTCEILYTEDLNDGQLFDSVRVRNPFTTNGIG